MPDNSYLELLGTEGYKQFEDAKRLAKEVGDVIVDTNGKVIDMYKFLKNNSSFQDFNKQAIEAKKNIEALESSTKKLEAVKREELKTEILREKAYAASAKTAESQNKALLAEGKALNELARLEKEEIKTKVESGKIAQQNLKTRQEQIKLNKLEAAEKAKLQSELLKEQKAIAELDNAYKQLSLGYGVALNKYKNLAAQYPMNHQLVVQAQQDAKVLNDRLKEIDAGVGNYQRNVGNYSGAFNGLKISINQLASEIPNFAQSMRIGIMSVGNNITQLGQSIAFAQQKNAELIAQGQKSVPIWKQVGGAILSWQTALVVGVTLLTVYGEKIINVLKGVTPAMAAAEKATKKYKDSLESIESQSRSTANEEIARLRVLEEIATSTTQSTKSRKKAVDEMQKIYPDYLKNISDEAIKQGLAKDAINEVTKALLVRAAAAAAEKKFAAASEQVYELTKAQEQATNDLQAAQAKLNSTVAGKNEEEKGINQFFNRTKVGDAKKALSDITGQLQQAQQEQNKYLADAKRLGAQAFDVIAPTKDKAAKDLKFNGDLLAAKVQQEARAEQSIFEDEKLLYTARLTARKRYSDDLIQIVRIEEKAALKNAKTAEERATIEQEASNKVQAIHIDEAKFVEGIIEKTTDKKKFTIIKGLDEELKAILESQDQRLKNEEKFNNESNRLAKQSAEYKKRLYQEISNTAFGIADAIIEKDKQSLDIDSANIDKKKEQEINAINASALSEEQKQDRIKNAELVAANAKEEIERKKLNLERKRFYLERTSAAANVTITSLKDIAAIKGQAAILASNPITAALAPIALAQIPVVAGTSAAALALILGQVALYGDGTDNHKGGDAIIGERFEPEWVEKNGKGQWVSTPTYFKDLAAGTSVTPLHDIVANAGGMSMSMAQSLAEHTGDERLLNEIKWLRTDIRNKPETTYIQENGSMTKKIRIGNRVSSYLDKNIYY